MYNWIHSSYFAIIFFTLVNLFLYGWCCMNAVSRTVLWRHIILKSLCSVIQQILLTFSPNKSDTSLQHLASISVRITMHLWQWRIESNFRSLSPLLLQLQLLSSSSENFIAFIFSFVYSGSSTYTDLLQNQDQISDKLFLKCSSALLQLSLSFVLLLLFKYTYMTSQYNTQKLY